MSTSACIPKATLDIKDQFGWHDVKKKKILIGSTSAQYKSLDIASARLKLFAIGWSGTFDST